MKCPFCLEESFAKKKNIMDGWKVAKVVNVCALCGKELPEEEKCEAYPAAARSAAFAALLGGESVEKITLQGSADRDFCRNCVNFIEHPFQTLCALDGSAADPMGSCEKFKERTTIL